MSETIKLYVEGNDPVDFAIREGQSCSEIRDGIAEKVHLPRGRLYLRIHNTTVFVPISPGLESIGPEFDVLVSGE